MKCAFPNCHHEALWVPAVALPTLRSVGMGQAMVQTEKPTYLLGKEVCQHHKETYNLGDWISKGDWEALQDLAHQSGYHIPEVDIMGVEFRPIGWEPSRHLELTDRN